jgi:hypothetical protein
MGFMWFKVLLSKVPNSAVADVIEGAVRQSQSKLIYVSLPMVPERNDALTRDFFTVDDGFIEDKAAVDVVSSPENEELIRRIAAKLKLEAIVLGENPQAFINDVLVSQGDKFVVEEADRKYEFVVVKIGQDTVFMRCQNAEITLKLASAVE